MKLTERKSVRYGGASVGLTIAVVAVVIALNMIVSGIFAVWGKNLDMTAENLFALSDESVSLLSKREENQHQVTIYFMADRDKLNQTASSANYYGDTSLWGMKYIVELADALAEKFSYIDVDFIDPTSQPGKIKQIVGSEYYDSHSFGSTSILIDNYAPERDNKGNILLGSDGKPLSYWHNFRYYTRDSFYGFNGADYSVISFKGEYRLISSILAVTEPITPTAYFITGHGEPVGNYVIGEETDDYGNAGYLWNLLRDCGYQIRKIDLQYEDFDTDENAVAVVFGPQTDYTNAQNSEDDGEIGKLKAFVEQPGHSLITVLNPGTRELPGLEGFLKEVGGVEYLDAKLRDSGDASVTVDGYSLVGVRQESGNLLSQTLQAVSAEEKVIFRNARPMRISDPSKAGAVFTIPASASPDLAEADEIRDGDALVAFSKLGEDSYLFALGTTMFPYFSYTEQPEYANREVVCAALSILSGEDTAYAVAEKVIPNEGLNLTTKQATVWTVVLAVTLPSVIAIIGLAVNVRRRFS